MKIKQIFFLIFLFSNLAHAGIYRGACEIAGQLMENATSVVGARECTNDTVDEYATYSCDMNADGGRYFHDGITRESVYDFNSLSDEVILQGTAMTAYNVNKCQSDFLNVYSTNTEKKADLLNRAKLAYREILPEIRRVIGEMDEVRETNIRRVPTNGSDYAVGRALERNVIENEENRLKQDELVNAVPLGNRSLMRDLILSSARGNVSPDRFINLYSAKLNQLKRQANESLGNVREKISGRAENGGFVFDMDDGFRRQLFDSGLVHNYIQENGLTEFANSGYLCRHQRDQRGCIAVEAAMAVGSFVVPHYALARIAFRAAVIANRARTATNIARSGRTALGLASRGILFSAESAIVIDDIQNACFTEEFLASTESGTCNAETQFYDVVASADTAGCIVAGAIGGSFLANTALAGANRIRRGAAARKAENEVIVINGVRGSRSGPRETYLSGSEYDSNINFLRNDRVLGENGLSLTVQRSGRLNSRQRTTLFEYTSEGESLTAAQARELQKLVNDGSENAEWLASRDNRLRLLLTETGVPANRLDDVAEDLLSSNILGTRVPRVRSNRSVARAQRAPTDRVPTPANTNTTGTLLDEDNLDDLLSSITRRGRRDGPDGTVLDFSDATRQAVTEDLRKLRPNQRRRLNTLFEQNPGKESQYLMMILRSDDVAATLNRLERLTPQTRDGIIRQLDDLINSPSISARNRSNLMKERFIIENGDQMTVTRLYDANSHNASLGSGTTGHSLRDSFGMDFRINDAPDGQRLQLCRGSYGSAGSFGFSGVAGGFMTLCRGSGYNDRGQLVQNLAAPNDVDALFPGYDRFNRFEARADQEFSFGLNGSVRYENGSGGRGGGVEIYSSRTGASLDSQTDLRASVRIPVCQQSRENCQRLFDSQTNIRAANLDGRTSDYVNGRLNSARTEVDEVIRADFNATDLQQALGSRSNPNQALDQYFRNNPELTSALNLRREIELKRGVNFQAPDMNARLDLESRQLQGYSAEANRVADVEVPRLKSNNPDAATYSSNVRSYLDSHAMVRRFRETQTTISQRVAQLRQASTETDQLRILQSISDLRGQQSDLMIGIRGMESSLTRGSSIDGSSLVKDLLGL